jgi:hypothetical protein
LLNRRKLMIGGLTLLTMGGVAACTLGFAMFANRYGVFGAILRRNLPDVQLPEAEIRKFVDAYLPEFLARRGRREAFLWRAATMIDDLAPWGAQITEEVERDVLTQFLIGSNFFQLSDPRSEVIEFFGLPSACPNPFYRT